jgi:glycerate 2-kinase
MAERAKSRQHGNAGDGAAVREHTADVGAFDRMRHTARSIFLDALAESSIPQAFAKNVQYDSGALRIGDDLYDLSNFGNVLVVSFGKAAHSMAESLAAATGAGLTGIIVDPVEHSSQLSGFRYFRGGHPTPNMESVVGARTILRLLKMQSQHSLVIYLISGGGSALVETPLDEDISLADLVATYNALVHSDAPIAEINCIRKHLSAIKGGRMARAASGAAQVSIMVSDVPDNALDSLASGPTMPDSTTVTDCYAIAHRRKLVQRFPASVRELIEKELLEETPKSDDPEFVTCRWWPILSNHTAQCAAAERATLAGFAVDVDNSCDDWDYAKAADYLLKKLRKLRTGVSRACLISGGEVTVKVEGAVGNGGRNQQFALYCAEKIAGENITVISAGTDGIDGNSPAAGAIADGTTGDRATAAGLNLDAALGGFNAFPLFDSLGDTVVTGPTGNNVRDLRILLAW